MARKKADESRASDRGFGERLKYLREQRGLTQYELATVLDVFPQEVSRLESGANSPRWTTVLDVCAALGCTPNDFLPK